MTIMGDMMFDYKTEEYREVVKGKVTTKTWQRKARTIRDLVGDESKEKILELGCGEVPFFDSSLKIDIAKIDRPNYIQHDMNRPLPIYDRFDYIVSSELVGHLHDLDTFFEECWRLLKDDGRLIISARNVGWWKTRLQLLTGNDEWFSSGYYKRFFMPRSFEKMLRRYGFKTIYEYNKNPKLPLSLSHGFMFVCEKTRPTSAWEKISVSSSQT